MRKRIVVTLLLACTPAFAVDHSYLGAWTPKPGRCRFETFGPFLITATGMEEHELVCRTKRTARSGRAWTVLLACDGIDNTFDLKVRWQILPNGHLREESQGKITDYVRCPG